jgi:hypothetical protein
MLILSQGIAERTCQPISKFAAPGEKVLRMVAGVRNQPITPTVRFKVRLLQKVA